ncbi:hypothetical protein [Caldimonas sp. KR1-144]|uniref:hypothetical protein n=1 Tax=Caldimonas sp. KR1-144 TaxID=3400911 RepID=UPI003C0B9E8A
MTTRSYAGGPTAVLPTSPAGSLRARLAAVLRALAVLLARAAVLVATPRPSRPVAPQAREFVDGALYEEGRLVGHVKGVKRL